MKHLSHQLSGAFTLNVIHPKLSQDGTIASTKIMLKYNNSQPLAMQKKAE